MNKYRVYILHAHIGPPSGCTSTYLEHEDVYADAVTIDDGGNLVFTNDEHTTYKKSNWSCFRRIDQDTDKDTE